MIPRPADKHYHCQECFYWMGKRDGRLDLVKQKCKWLMTKKERYGSLAKLLLYGKRRAPVGFIQFGPISEYKTAHFFYKDHPFPNKGWCIVCVTVQPECRGKGLALAMVKKVLSDLKKRGVGVVDAFPMKSSRSWSQVSVGPSGLFEKAGFKSIFEMKLPNGEIEAIMRRKLS